MALNLDIPAGRHPLRRLRTLAIVTTFRLMFPFQLYRQKQRGWEFIGRY
jgi:hypothetical protein